MHDRNGGLMMSMLADFRFLQPLWLLALLPLGLLVWLWARVGRDGLASSWRGIVDAPLLAVLAGNQRLDGHRWSMPWPYWVLALAWLIAVLALANPSFERQSVPVFETGEARVLVLDLSRSMLAEDLRPNRLLQAKFKLEDVLARAEGARLGLVVFAGDAFGVVPLTDDVGTLDAMLGALEPGLMPLPGSRPDLGIEQALRLLEQGVATEGQVLLLTDDAGGPRALAAAERLRVAGHRLSVLGVGTRAGAEVPGVSSGDAPVISRLDEAALRALASAGGGAYSRLRVDGVDLDRVLAGSRVGAADLQDEEQRLTEIWKPLGPWIALALLPLGLLAFRRGWLLTLAVLMLLPGLLASPRPAIAGLWEDLWQRPDQQSASALMQGEYDLAAERAPGAEYLGSARYRQGDFEAAAEAFASGDSPWHHYNRGNALAQSGQLREALNAFDQALRQDPEMPDARYNRQQVQALLDREREQAEQQPQASSAQDAEAANAPSEETGAESASNSGTTKAPTSESRGQEQPEAEDMAGGALDPESSSSERGGGAGQASESQLDAMGQDASAPDSEDQGQDQGPEVQQAEAPDQDSSNSGQGTAGTGTNSQQEPLDAQALEARQAADQWLRRIPDDPGGLLRRKFLYQYRERGGNGVVSHSGEPW